MKNLGMDVSSHTPRVGDDFAEAQEITVPVVNTIPWPLLVLDSDLRIKTANKAFYRTFHVSPFEAEGQPLFFLSSGLWGAPSLRQMLGRVLPDDMPAIGHKVLELSGCRMDRLQFILLLIRDVTGCRERDSEARRQLAAIVESSDDAILSTTGDEFLSRENLRIPGSGSARPACLDSGRAHYETKRRRKDGSPIPGRNGVITGAFVLDRDITALKKMQLEALARQKFESLGRLAGGVAPDFNNLLSGVLSYAELALTLLPESSAAKEEMLKIRAVAPGGAEIVRESMVCTRQDSGDFEPVDVSRTVAGMLELLKVSISRHAVLEAGLEEGLPLMRARPAQIRQVVMNLVTNASEAIGDRGRVIRVATTRVTAGRNAVVRCARNLPEGEYLRLEVSDTGCGMTAEAQAGIFDQGIVEAHGGAIDLQSAPGKGTTVQILLPGAAAPAQDTQNRKPSSSTGETSLETKAGLAPETILLVEDEPALRLAVSKMLRKSGFPVIEACNGSEAVDLIRAHKTEIAVILLDFTLPGLPSQQVFEQARRIRPDIKVILTSAYSRNIIDASFKGLREDRFIRKPYALGDLVGLLRDTMSA